MGPQVCLHAWLYDFSVLVTFLFAVVKHSEEKQLTSKRTYSGSQLAMMPQWHELEAAGHIVAEVRKERLQGFS